MKISYHPCSLYTKKLFKTHKFRHEVCPHIFLKCTYEGLVGYGSIVLLPAHYETPQKIVQLIHSFDAYKKYFEDYKVEPQNTEEALNKLINLYPEGALALEMAMLDLQSQIDKKPLYQYLELSSRQLITPMTLGFKPLAELEEDLEVYKNWKSLKIKLGADLKENLDKIAFIYSKYSGSIRMDANGALSFEQALKLFEELEKYPESFIQYVEQPIAVGQYDKLKLLKEKFRTLVFVDEDVRNIIDIENIYQCVDGINIQGYKSGGLKNLLKMNTKAQNLGLKTMLGCQAESVLGVTALSHIANAFDYCDLDGHLLFKEDYFSGLEVNEGICKLQEGYGIGAKLINNL